MDEGVSLRDALAAERQPKVKGPPCTIHTLLSDDGPLDEGDRDTLRAALADESIQGAQIARALASMEVEVKPHTVNRHRSGVCRCET